MVAPINYSALATSFVGLGNQMDGLANGAKAVSASVFDNSSGRYFHCLVELDAAFVATPAANGTVDVYFLPSLDGTNFDIGAAAGTTPSDALLVATFQPIQSASQRMIHRAELITSGVYKIAVVNRAGFAMAASANVLSVRPFTDESG